MKELTRNFITLTGIFALMFCFNLVAFGQSEAGDVEVETGSKILRIGILLPKVQLTEVSGEVEPEEALRNTYAALLNSDLFELVALDSRLTSLALDEARKKSCDFILNVDLAQEEKKSGSGIFGKVLKDAGNRTTGEVARKVPYGGGTGERIAGTTVRSTILNTGYTMTNMSVTIKKNDKFTLDYNLTNAVTGDVFHTNQIEAKAKKNNDPVLMGLIEESAEDLVTVLKKNVAQ